MTRIVRILIGLFAIAIFASAVVFFSPIGEDRAEIDLDADVSAGNQLLMTAGCYACHTDTDDDGLEFAGGAPLVTDFGVFYGPNITASQEFGIGNWTLKEFEAALRQGKRPDGQAYYPAFPYLSYRSLTDQDVADLYAALMATEPVHEAAQDHALSFPFNLRLAMKPWQWLFGTTESLNIDQSTPEGRGRYLVDVVAHCGECHTPRNSLGAFVPPYLGGSTDIPGGDAPPIHARALINLDWTELDMFYFLSDGMMVNGDFVGGSMAEVIDYGTSQMSDADREAISTYLFSRSR